MPNEKNRTDNFSEISLKKHKPRKNENDICVRSVRILSYSGPYFPVFEFNTEIYRVSPNAGKCEPEKLKIWTLFTRWTTFVYLFSDFDLSGKYIESIEDFFP